MNPGILGNMEPHMSSKNYLPGNNLVIPETNNEYLLHLAFSESGVVSDVVVVFANNLLDKTRWIKEDDDGMLEVPLFGKPVKVTKEWLVCFTYNPLFEAKDFALKLLTGSRNKQDYHPSNLYWKIPVGGIEDPQKPGFFIIPDYSRHSVSADGLIWSRKMNRFGTTRPSGNGKGNVYQNTCIVSNVGEVRTVGIHRAIALAMLSIDGDPSKLTVNHKTGEKKFNNPDRLEWNTYSENNIHAKANLLQKTRQPVLARDYVKGTLYRFVSKSAAAYYYGLNTGILVDACKRNRIVRSSLEFRDENPLGEYGWCEGYFECLGYSTAVPEIQDKEEHSRRICVYDLVKNEVVIHKDQYELALAEGIKPVQVLYLLSHAFKQVENNKLVCYVDELDALREKIVDGSIVHTRAHANVRNPITVEVINLLDKESKIEKFSFNGLDRASDALFPAHSSKFLARKLAGKQGFAIGNMFYRVTVH